MKKRYKLGEALQVKEKQFFFKAKLTEKKVLCTHMYETESISMLRMLKKEK